MKTLLYILGAIVLVFALMTIFGHVTAFLLHWGVLIAAVVAVVYIFKKMFNKSSK